MFGRAKPNKQHKTFLVKDKTVAKFKEKVADTKHMKYLPTFKKRFTKWINHF